MSFGIIVLRTLVSGSYPQIPASWDYTYESSDWITIYPQGKENPQDMLHAHLEAVSGSVGAFSVFATSAESKARLKAFADSSNRAWTLRELRADNSALATRLKTAWRTLHSGTSQPIVESTIMGFGYSTDAETHATLAELTGSI